LLSERQQDRRSRLRITIRIHEVQRMTAVKVLGLADGTWSAAQLVDAALQIAPFLPIETCPRASPQIHSNGQKQRLIRKCKIFLRLRWLKYALASSN
jgi:hypothetical protein